MSGSIFLPLLQNAAILLASVAALDLALRKQEVRTRLADQMLVGVVLGLVAIALMRSAFVLQPGLVFDTRAILLSLSGLFFGPVATIVAMALAAAYRLLQGGLAAGVGATSIVAAGLVGLAWRRRLRDRVETMTPTHLFVFGLVVQVVVLVTMGLLPAPTAWLTLTTVALPMLTIFPFATVVLGLLLSERLRRQRESRELAASEAHYRGLFEHSRAVMLLVDADRGTIVDANPAATRFYGWSREELRATSLFALSAAHADTTRAELARARRLDDAIIADVHRRSDQQTREVELFIGPVDFAGRQLLYAIVQDVTERRRIEEALRRSEQRWQFALEGAGDGVWDWNMATGETYFSPRWASMLGHDISELRPHVEEWERRVHPADLPIARAHITAYLEGRVDHYACEHRMRAKDGSWRWILDRGRIVEYDADGRPLRLIGTHCDITERKQASERLVLLDTALQSTTAGIVITNAEGVIEWANRGFSTMTGYSPEEIAGLRPNFLKSGHQAPEFYADLWRTITQGLVWSGELVNRRKDGSEYQERMIITPVAHEGAAITHYVAIKEDITEHKRLEQQLLRSQRLESIGTLAGGIAHDLNNALAPIALGVGLLRHVATAPADAAVLGTIDRSARRSAELVKQVLSFARGAGGRKVILQLKHIVREIEGFVRSTFPKNIHIETHLPGQLGTVLGDPTQLHQVLLNLCVNARDALLEGGSLTLSATDQILDADEIRRRGGAAPGPYILIDVTDTGCGMTPTVLDRIFEPFFTTKEVGKGTGLGLSTALGIVRAHGGFITVASRPGEGSTFTVGLPAAEAAPADEAPTHPANAEPTVPVLGVLVVDDETPLLELTRQLLDSRGYRVMTAPDGAQALKLFDQHRAEIAVVITDLMMPSMDGLTLIQALRKIAPRLPIITTSGLSGTAPPADAAALDPVPIFLPKPFVGDALLAALAAVRPPAEA